GNELVPAVGGHFEVSVGDRRKWALHQVARPLCKTPRMLCKIVFTVFSCHCPSLGFWVRGERFWKNSRTRLKVLASKPGVSSVSSSRRSRAPATAAEPR